MKKKVNNKMNARKSKYINKKKKDDKKKRLHGRERA